MNKLSRILKTLSKKTIIAFFALIIIGGPILYLVLLNAKKSEAAWFNDNWGYRKAVTVTVTSSASDISSLETLVTVDTTGITANLQTNCEDLRFTNASGQLLPYYIDSCSDNSATNKVWVMADLVPKNTTTYTLYMYYGNPSAAAASDANTFWRVKNLEGYWTLNDTSGNRVDSSVNGNTLTDNATVTSATGQYSNAGQFTRANSEYLNITSNSTLQTGNIDFTISGWVYVDGNQGQNRVIITKGNDTANTLEYYLILGTDDKFTLQLGQSDGTIGQGATDPTTRSTGTWYFVVGWFDSVADTVNIQINNGDIKSSAVTSPPTASTGEVRVSSWGSSASLFWDGRIDDVRFYKRVLTSDERAQLYTNPGTIATTAVGTSNPSTAFADEEKAPSPVAYWKFDEGTGKSSSNSVWKSGSAITNMITNPSFETGTTSWTTTGATIAQSSAQSYFGSNSVLVTFPTGNSFDRAKSSLTVSELTTYTISAYVYRTETTKDLRIGFWDSGDTLIRASATAAAQTGWQRLTVSYTTIAGETSIQAAIWRNGGETGSFTAYMDGVQVTQSATETNYCDGAQTGRGSYSWTGTAHASTSTCNNGTDAEIATATWQTEDQCIAGKCLYTSPNHYALAAGTVTGVQTVSFWVKPNTLSGTVPFVQLTSTPAYIYASGTTLTSSGITSPTYYVNGISGATTLTANQWNFVTVTVSSSNAITANGIIFGKQSTNFLTGFIDDVKFYGNTRSAPQVLTDFASRGSVKGASSTIGSDPQNNIAALSNGLVGYWKMDESSGNTADSSGNGTTLTNNNTTTYAAGKFGNGGSFAKASTQYFSAVDSSTLRVGTGNFTISSWVYLNSATIEMLIASKYDTASKREWVLEYNFTDQRFEFTMSPDGTSTTTVKADNLGAPATGQWYFVVGWYDGVNMNISVNGGTPNTTAYTTGTTSNTAPFEIGGLLVNGTTTLTWDGKIDEVRLYKRALSTADISALYNFAPGPVGYWNLDENTGTSANDRSGNANTGTLNNGPTWKPGKYGAGVNFDGTNDSISVDNTMTVQNISYWIKPSTSAYAVGLSGSQRYLLNNGLYSGTATATRYINGVTPTSESLGSELLTNGTIETGATSPWTPSFSAPGAGNVSTTTTSPYAGTYSLDLNITNGGTSQSQAQVYHNSNFSLTSGTLYKVQFATKGSTAISGMQATPRKNGSPYTEFGVNYTFDITTSWVLHTYYFYATTTASDAQFFFYAGNHGVFHIYLDNISVKPVSSVGDLTSNVWNFVSVNLDSPVSADDFNLGVVNSRYLQGTIDEVRLYNYSRSQKQITEDLNAGHPAPGSPVGSAIGHWKFDEGADNLCSGGTNDACNSGNGGSTLDGAQSGMASPATATSGWTNSGKFGKALIFDGTNDYVDFGTSTTLNPTTTMAASLWTNWTSVPTAGGGGTQLLGRRTAANVGGYTFDWDVANTKLCFYVYTSSWIGACDTTDPSTSTWYHYTGTYDGSNVKLYVNGVLKDTQAQTGSINAPAANTYAGFNNLTGQANAYFSGSIDEVKIYNSALTADQVKMDMNRSQAQVMGSLSDKSTYQPQAANQEYCVPGDTSASCGAPIAEWKFDENQGASANDTSGNGYIGTWNGTLGSQWKPGKYGSGGNFNGSDNYIDAGSGSSLNLSTAVSIEAWINPSLTNNQGIIEKTVGGTVNTQYLLFLDTGSAYFRLVKSATLSTINSNTTLTANQWYHIVGTWDGTTMKMYLNGVQQTMTATVNSPIDSGVGATYIGQLGGSIYRFSGKIDQAKIFNYARSAAQVAWDYNRGGPVGHWKFDECQGTSTYDNSGNSNTGTITVGGAPNTAVGTCTGSANTMWKDGATGKYNSSLDFDGTDDYVTVGNNSIFNTTSGTVAAWVKVSSLPGSDWVTVASKWVNDPNGYRLLIGTSGQAMFQIGDGSGSDSATSANNAVSTNTWVHIVGIWQAGAGVSLYVNGALSVAPTGTRTISYSGTPGSINIGKNVTEWYLNGQIDDIRIFNYALTATQVKTLMNQGGAVRFGPVTGSP